MLRLFLVFLSLRLSFSLPVALLPPHRAASSRSVSRGRQGGNRSSVSLSGKSPPPQSAWTARRLRLLLIDADVYGGTASWGGEVLFHFAPLVFFSPYSILLGVVHSHCVQLHKRGIGALCAEFRRCIGLSTPPQLVPAWVASRWLRDGKKRGRKCTETGSFLHRLPPFVFESGARRVSSNRVVVVRGRAQTVPAANEMNAGQKRNL